MKRNFQIPPVLGVLGFLGLLGFFFAPIFCTFFAFFSFFFWGLLTKEQSDERLEENINRAGSIAGRLGLILCFFLLFALDKQIPSDTVLLYGSIAYAVVFTLPSALAYFLDRRG